MHLQRIPLLLRISFPHESRQCGLIQGRKSICLISTIFKRKGDWSKTFLPSQTSTTWGHWAKKKKNLPSTVWALRTKSFIPPRFWADAGHTFFVLEWTIHISYWISDPHTFASLLLNPVITCYIALVMFFTLHMSVQNFLLHLQNVFFWVIEVHEIDLFVMLWP